MCIMDTNQDMREGKRRRAVLAIVSEVRALFQRLHEETKKKSSETGRFLQMEQ